MGLDWPISDIDDAKYPFDIPTYRDLYSTGMNIDKALAYLFGGSALATFDKSGRMVAGTISSARRMREAGGVRVNGVVFSSARLVATMEDVRRGRIVVGIGKPSNEGGKGYAMPIPVFEYLGECYYLISTSAIHADADVLGGAIL